MGKEGIYWVETPVRTPLPEIEWENVMEAGCYVDEGSGDLYRIRETLFVGIAPLVVRESRGPSRLHQLSKDPFLPTLRARNLCLDHSIEPNF